MKRLEIHEALQLMKAAPDLLERLKTHADAACLGWNHRFYLPDCGCGPCRDRAAIAKAEGRLHVVPALPQEGSNA